jgi:hypothetical protein
MRIGIIGKLDGDERLYGRLADRVGHEALFHDGTAHAHAALADLVDLVDRSDVVVLLSAQRSGAAQLAKRRLRQRGLSPLVLPRCGVAQFTALLEALNARALQATS